jgi:creatinine amidohydrolase
MDPEDFRKRFADGRMWSNPGLATEKHGKLLFETSTKSVIADFNNFVTKEKCVQ